MPTAKGTGRRFALDYRDGDHLLRAVTPPTRPRRKTWRLSARLDQGWYPHCVGYAWKHFLLATPRQQGAETGPGIYHGAQVLDEWPGENYQGTSVRAGAKFLVERGLVESYRWAFSAEDVLNAVGNFGPVVMGTDWTSGMSDPTSEGIMRFTGSLQGGHAYVILGYSDARGLALVHNSWGASWGINGRAWFPHEDLEAAIREAGEACMAVEVPR
jgi:hypothetical protein